MDRETKKSLYGFYREHLFTRVLPFWMNRAIDHEYGGYFNCFDNLTGRLLSTDKYTWSQGRFVWVLSRLAGTAGGRDYLAPARSGADFIENKCIMENGSCAFLLDREGNPGEPFPGAGPDASIYADMFAVSGLSEYGRVSGEEIRIGKALGLYRNIKKRLETGRYRTHPYPVPRGFRSHGIAMIMLNTSQTLGCSLRAAGMKECEAVEADSRKYMEEAMSFITGGRMLEFIGEDGRPVDSLIGTCVNPGHCLEDAWFIAHSLQGADACPERMKTAASAAGTAFRLGWDPEYGGLFLYTHKNGGPPSGKQFGGDAGPMEEKMLSAWDCKLWWVHSEALYSSLLFYTITGEKRFMEMHDTVKEYVFRTFPHPDESTGEWIQIRDRRGRPADTVVALPVKDPFHIARSLILLLELLGAPRCHPGPGPARRGGRGREGT